MYVQYPTEEFHPLAEKNKTLIAAISTGNDEAVG